MTFGETMEQTAQDSPISMLPASPVVEGTDSDFARLLQPVVTSQEIDENVVDEVDDIFSKYLQPTTRHNTSNEQGKYWSYKLIIFQASRLLNFFQAQLNLAWILFCSYS